MKLAELTQRTRLQRRLTTHPGDIAARKMLARNFVNAGEIERAAAELIVAVKQLIAAGDAVESHKLARAALVLTPTDVESRLTMARVHARFPDVHMQRAASPIEDIFDLTSDLLLEEIDLSAGSGVQELPLDPNEITRPPLPADALPPMEVEDDDVLEAVDARAAFDGRDEVTSPGRRVGPARVERRRSARERAIGAEVESRRDSGPAADHIEVGDATHNPLFEALTAAQLDRVFALFHWVEYVSGTTVLRPDDEVERLAIVQAGAVTTSAGATLAAGSVVAIAEALGGRPSGGAVIAAGPVVLLEADLGALRALAADDPTLADALAGVLHAHVAENWVTRATLFAELPDDEVHLLAEKVVPLQLDAGDVVLRPGERSRRLMVVGSGELVIDGRRSSVGRVPLRAGDFFGFTHAVLGADADVTVVAAAPSVLLVISAPDVLALLGRQPALERTARAERGARGAAPISIESVAGVGAVSAFRPKFGAG